MSTTLRKAAILVASLDTAAADRLLDQMGEEQASRVRRAVMDLDNIDPREEQAVLEEFFRLGEPQPERRATATHDRDRATVRNSNAPAEPESLPFRFLKNARGERITPLLVGEHPQTIALVVAHLPAEQAVEVLSTIDIDLQADVLSRVANLDDAHPDMLREVERGLHSRIAELSRDEQRRVVGVATLERILDAAPRTMRRQLVANLARHDRSLAEQLTPATPDLTFHDLITCADNVWQVLLTHVEHELIVLAMADAPMSLVNRVLSLAPAGQRKGLKRALDHLGPTRLADVEAAQRALAETAGRLAAEGQVRLFNVPSRAA